MASSESVATSSNGGSRQFAGPLIASLPSAGVGAAASQTG